MPSLQYPFTAGLSPTSVQAIQSLIQQNEQRQWQKAQAKAESERLKTQSTRRIGEAVSSSVVEITKAFMRPKLLKEQRDQQIDLMQNRSDIKNFGTPTKQLDDWADASRLELEQATEQSIDPTRFRAEYRQQIVQRQAQEQQQAKSQQAQQRQMQKAATEQYTQSLALSPEFEYDPSVRKRHALLNEQHIDSVLNPDMSLPPEQRQLETRELAGQMRQISSTMGTRKPKFEVTQHLDRYTKTVPGLGTFIADPQGGGIKFHAERKSKGDDQPLTSDDAYDKAYDDLDNSTPEQVREHATILLQEDREKRQRRAGFKKQVMGEQRAQGLHNTKFSNVPAAPPRGNLGRILQGAGVIPGGAPMPRQPARPPAVVGQPQQPQQQQQRQKPQVHPALAKIAPQNINQKAVDIIQKAGGTGDPIALDDLKRRGLSNKEIKASLRKGQIVIIQGNAYVWSGRQFVAMEKS